MFFGRKFGQRILNLPKFGLDRYIQQAEEMLKNYRSWYLYCVSFDSSEMEGKNFFLAKLFQEDAEKVESNDVGAAAIVYM